MPRGSRRRVWLLGKDAEAGARAAEAGRSAAGGGAAVSPGFGPAVLTCVICPAPRHRPCAPLLPVLPSSALCHFRCPPYPRHWREFIFSGLVPVMGLALPCPTFTGLVHCHQLFPGNGYTCTAFGHLIWPGMVLAGCHPPSPPGSVKANEGPAAQSS